MNDSYEDRPNLDIGDALEQSEYWVKKWEKMRRMDWYLFAFNFGLFLINSLDFWSRDYWMVSMMGALIGLAGSSIGIGAILKCRKCLRRARTVQQCLDRIRRAKSYDVLDCEFEQLRAAIHEGL